MAETITVFLQNVEIHADRQAQKNPATFWKPQSSSWQLLNSVAVEVPQTHEYVYNIREFEKKAVGALFAETPEVLERPVLTVKGYAYVQKALENALAELDPQYSDVLLATEEDTRWDEELSASSVNIDDIEFEE